MKKKKKLHLSNKDKLNMMIGKKNRNKNKLIKSFMEINTFQKIMKSQKKNLIRKKKLTILSMILDKKVITSNLSSNSQLSHQKN